MGPEVRELEQKLAELVGVRHCISVASGTTALQVAMMALDQQPALIHLESAKQSFPNAETAANRVLSLPFHPYLEEETVATIAKTIVEVAV